VTSSQPPCSVTGKYCSQEVVGAARAVSVWVESQFSEPKEEIFSCTAGWQRLDMVLCVRSTGQGNLGLASPDSFPVKGEEGVLLVSCRGGEFKFCSSCICVRSSLFTTSLFFWVFFFFLIESLALGTLHLV